MPPVDSQPLAEYIRQATETAANAFMDAEVEAAINAAHYERSQQRTAYRNGYRTRRWRTPSGKVTLHIPKLRSGSYYPAFLEVADEAAAALAALARQALTGALTPDALPAPFDDAATADTLIAALYDHAAATCSRPLRGPFPALITERCDGKLIVYGERANGTRHLLDVCEDTPSAAYWRSVVRGWAARGLHGVTHIDSSGASGDALRRAMQADLPQASADPLQRRVIAALGMPLDRQAIDPSAGPRALLDIHTDAVLTPVVSAEGLAQLRRYMRHPADAIGEPLRAA